MGNYNELIKKFDKIRDYMRDFYIYGFRSRTEFKQKSSRTYDNEKRRIESYMGEYMKWGYSKYGKRQFITMNCSHIQSNPLYSAWKSKTFTDNDIVLHFYILSALYEYKEMNIDNLTNKICENSGKIFDIQTVRNKCKEYVNEGLLIIKKDNKSHIYSLSNTYLENLLNVSPNLINAVKFFQGNTEFGVIGDYILTNNNIKNDIFLFKHYYIAHTLEDEILIDIFQAIRTEKLIEIVSSNEQNTWSSKFLCVPLKIFVSSRTGRRYLCVYSFKTKRFFNYRLDHIKSVKILEQYKDTNILKEKLEKNKTNLWGVCFGGKSRIEIITMKLFIDEKFENHIIDRINKEKINGSLTRTEENTFIFTTELLDSNDISPWIKTFMGRILLLEGSNQTVVNRFYNDVKKMREMYND